MCTFRERKVCFSSALCYDSNQCPHQPSSAFILLTRKASMSRDCRKRTALQADLQFSTQHIDCVFYFPKKPEIGRNELRNKGERNVCSTNGFFQPSQVRLEKKPFWNKQKKPETSHILQLVKSREFFSLNYPNDFHIQFIEQAAQVDGWIFKKRCIVINWNDNHI